MEIKNVGRRDRSNELYKPWMTDAAKGKIGHQFLQIDYPTDSAFLHTRVRDYDSPVMP